MQKKKNAPIIKLKTAKRCKRCILHYSFVWYLDRWTKLMAYINHFEIHCTYHHYLVREPNGWKDEPSSSLSYRLFMLRKRPVNFTMNITKRNIVIVIIGWNPLWITRRVQSDKLFRCLMNNYYNRRGRYAITRIRRPRAFSRN